MSIGAGGVIGQGAPQAPPPKKGLNLVLELLSQATQGAITVDLPSEP